MVDIIVTDRKGRHVDGLSARDFVVYENGVQQKIVTFVPSLVSEATTPASHADNASAASPNVQPRASRPSQPAVGLPKAASREAEDLARVRFITLVMDLGDLQPTNIKRACDAAADYVEKVIAPEDFIAVYWIDHSLHLAQPFTQDRSKTLEALKRLSARTSAGRMTTLARMETQQEIQELLAGMAKNTGGTGRQVVHSTLEGREFATLMKFLWTQSTLQARAVFVAMRAIAEAYQDLPGRKNVVVFSEGFMHSPDAATEMTAVIDAANHANVAFYIVDAAGLTAEFSAQKTMREVSVNEESLLAALWGPDGELTTGLSEFDWIKHLGQDIQYDDLSQVAAATGGFYIKRQNDLLHGLELADSDLREFYTVVYQPANTKYDGSFRSIKVGLQEKGYHLRYRRGYWAIPLGDEMMMTPAAAQLMSSIASGGLKVAFKPQMNAAVLIVPEGKLVAPVHVSMPGKTVTFVKHQDVYHTGMTLLVAARDRAGRLVSVHQRFLDLRLNNEQREDFERKTLDINVRLAIPRLEPLKLEAILQLPDGKVGLGQHEISVSEASATGLRLTSLVLSNDIEPAQGSSDSSDPLRGANFQLYLPAQPHFVPSDKMTLYFGVVRETETTPAVPIRVRLSFTIEQSGNVMMNLPVEEVRAPPGAPLRVLKQFDVKSLPPGDYTLVVYAEDPETHAVTSQRASFVIG